MAPISLTGDRDGHAGAGPASAEWRRAHSGSGMTSSLILAYVEREHGREGVSQLLARCGLRELEAELRDENSRFSASTPSAV